MGKLENKISDIHGKSVYFDSNVFIYYLGGHEELLTVAKPFFQAVENGVIRGASGPLAIAELLVKPMRTNDLLSIERIKSLFETGGYFSALPHPRETLELAAHIRASQGLRMVDAIHVATAIKENCDYFLSHDNDIKKRVSGIEVIDIGEFL